MPPRSSPGKRSEVLQGTLDMLILRTLLLGPQHGYGIVRSLRHSSEDVILVDAGSLYPALHRLTKRGWIGSQWGTTRNNRRAKFYRLTAAGRRQLQVEGSKWERLVEAIARIMNPAREEK